MSDNYKNKIETLLAEADLIRSEYSDKAFDLYDKAYALASENKWKREKAAALIGMVMMARTKSDVKVMLEKAFEAVEIYEAMGDDHQYARTQNLIGIAYFYNGMYEQASENFLQALKACDDGIHHNLRSSIYNNLGEVYREASKYEMAFDYYQKGLEVCQKAELTINMASLFGNMGEVSLDLKRFEDALEYSERSYKILYNSDHEILLAESENRLGRVYYEMGCNDVAEKFYEASLQRFMKTKNKFYTVDVLMNKAILHHDLDPNKAFLFLNNALRYAELSSAKKKVLRIYKLFADFHEQDGDFRMAYDYFKKYHYLERELKISVMGDTLEILKLELSRLERTSNNTELEKVRLRFEAEIEHQKIEMDKFKEKNRVLEERVYVDALTGVSSRSYLDVYASELLSLAEEHGESFSLFMIDIDKFKLYNDFWGHLQGDECLRRVAGVMKTCQEKHGHIFGRYGGEEFIYCARGLNLEEAKTLGEELREAVEGLMIKYNSFQNQDVLTITLGCAHGLFDEDASLGQIIGLADEALYEGKNNGRNQVVIRSNI